MRTSRFTAEQISMALRQAGAGTPVGDVCFGHTVDPNLPKRSGEHQTLRKRRSPKPRSAPSRTKGAGRLRNPNRVLGLLGLLFTLAVAPGLEAQQPEQLRIAVVVGDPGPMAEFTQRQLEDAVTVLVTAKAPDVRIASVAELWLYIVPACLDLYTGWSCSLTAALDISAEEWFSPFMYEGFTHDVVRLSDPPGVMELDAGFPKVTMWQAHVLLSGPPGESFRQVREVLDVMLDQPIAGWRRLPEDARGCWIRFLNNPWWDEASWEGARGSPASALQFGPCG